MKTHKIIGLMSGTSLDGLDLAYCKIWQEDKGYNFEIAETHSVSYSDEMKQRLKNSIYLAADELLIFHNTYGTWLGEQVLDFINSYDLEVDCVASHGHTTHHQPQNGLTFQIGSGQHLANACHHKVVCDFRTNDVALHGQGAPLVPIGDRLFFGQYDFCLNLGGISNISFEKNGERLAYDIGLANMVLNYITRKHGLEFDKGGQLARGGKINPTMLEQLNDLGFYKLPYPKSIGYEWFVDQVVPIVEATDDSMPNLLRTAIDHICEQIALQVKANSPADHRSLLVTGGGALNDFLIETLQSKLGPTAQVTVPETILVEFKEALVFALMGALRLEQKTNVLCSVTGARSDSSSGVIYLPT
ncbi:anhydro-N-acetylmuramic acid kinase [Pseudozobellia thermophila]|uniref:Anhydro-N-acetylmuramic acid kinase n=1 Tax=Pseudozobellia thermophila TaxID=192903 RepID=A0A1M6IZQ7_9FLAO|nr:anhydro-N-acetylmuramic acid kinase [Pseudozobellia thermophila]SHJ39913.1 anhydro-N-acetylmuramic acid kinase [Pseudozobellia thermophila]